VEIRKQKREENLAKRRFLSAQALGTSFPDAGAPSAAVAGSTTPNQTAISQGGKPAPPRVDDIPRSVVVVVLAAAAVSGKSSASIIIAMLHAASPAAASTPHGVRLVVLFPLPHCPHDHDHSPSGWPWISVRMTPVSVWKPHVVSVRSYR